MMFTVFTYLFYVETILSVIGYHSARTLAYIMPGGDDDLGGGDSGEVI